MVMKDQLRIRLGAVTLALLTLAAIVFAFLNFEQRYRFVQPDDGVTWRDPAQGVLAPRVGPGPPGDHAGIKPGDVVESVRGVAIHHATDVTRLVWRAGPWTEIQYGLKRSGESFRVLLITAPQQNPSSIENYLRVTALLYLFIGLFIFARRWNAPRAIHFYVFCLVSFVLYSFHYSGKLNSFDWIIYWSNVVATLLQPALLMHFALVFPERRGRLWPKLAAVYAIPSVMLALYIFISRGMLGFAPSLAGRDLLGTIDLVYMVAYFLTAAAIFLASYLRAPSGILRQQLKWVTAGTFAGILPFLLFYIVPRIANAVPQPWMKLSALSLAFIPLCLGYAIIRYRLMDVDIIFKRGLAYTFATAGVVAIYFALIATIGELSHTAWPAGPGGAVIAIVIAAFLFQPLREWVQARLDHFFYRDRLDYRRTLIEFGRALTNEGRLEPLLSSALARISQTLLVDRLAVFLEDSARPEEFALARRTGINPSEILDLSFLHSSRL